MAIFSLTQTHQKIFYLNQNPTRLSPVYILIAPNVSEVCFSGRFENPESANALRVGYPHTDVATWPLPHPSVQIAEHATRRRGMQQLAAIVNYRLGHIFAHLVALRVLPSFRSVPFRSAEIRSCHPETATATAPNSDPGSIAITIHFAPGRKRLSAI